MLSMRSTTAQKQTYKADLVLERLTRFVHYFA